jgi:hypothetical protein
MDEFGDDADLTIKFVVTIPLWAYVFVVAFLERHYPAPRAQTPHSDARWQLNF